MSTSTSLPRVEHASDPADVLDRDAIVLSADELADAHRIARDTPRYAITFLPERDARGFVTGPRVRAKFEAAARFVAVQNLLPVYDADKPAPTVTSTTTERVLPAIQTDADGNRYLLADDYQFLFVEHPDPDFPTARFAPHVVVDADPEMDEDAFAVFAADAERFARAIKTALHSSWSAA